MCSIIFIHNKPFVPENSDENIRFVKMDVETRHALSLQSFLTDSYDDSSTDQCKESIGIRRFQNQGQNSLSSIIGSFKSAVTRHLRQERIEFSWQPRFYDSIISDIDRLNKIRWYIRNNPKNWENDTFIK